MVNIKLKKMIVGNSGEIEKKYYFYPCKFLDKKLNARIFE